MSKVDPHLVADDFARRAPIGTPCRYYPLKPCTGLNFIDTNIRSEPFIMGGGQVVVKIDGRVGGVSVEHITFPATSGGA